MTGIEPAVYAGIMAFAAIVGLAWKVHGYIRGQIDEGVKPLKEADSEMRAVISVQEAKSKLLEESLTVFRLEVAKTYTTKEDVFNANKPVLDSVERLTHSVDKMNTRIDRVIEQSNAAKPANRRRPAE